MVHDKSNHLDCGSFNADRLGHYISDLPMCGAGDIGGHL